MNGKSSMKKLRCSPAARTSREEAALPPGERRTAECPGRSAEELTGPMKRTIIAVTALLLAPLAMLHGADSPSLQPLQFLGKPKPENAVNLLPTPNPDFN